MSTIAQESHRRRMVDGTTRQAAATSTRRTPMIVVGERICTAPQGATHQGDRPTAKQPFGMVAFDAAGAL